MATGQEEKVGMVICKNPLCMRFFVVSSSVTFDGTTEVRLTCTECKRAHNYTSKDVRFVVGPQGTAINPV